LSTARFKVALLAGALLGAAACTIVNGLTVPEPTPDGGAGDAQVDVDPCPHAFPPPEPEAAPVSGDIVFTVVARSVTFARDADAGPDAAIGFDLDNTCTCPKAESCKPFVARNTLCDDERGRDNAMQALVAEARDVYGFDIDDNANTSVDKGASGILMQVQNYNGEPDDPDVRVATLVSPGLYTVLPDGGTGPQVTPTFTPADRWATLPDQVAPRDLVIAPVSTGRGYVKDYTLVVRNDVTLRFRPGMRMTFPDALIVAHITKLQDGSWSVDRGTVSGRWPVTNVLKVFGAVEQPRNSGNYLCTSPLLANVFAELKKRACEGADIAANAADDNTGAVCDAASGAFSFIAAPASLGPPVVSPDLDPCGDAGLSCAP
jgi:hypothetical protein